MLTWDNQLKAHCFSGVLVTDSGMAQDLNPSSYCELKVFSKKQRWGLTCLIKKFCLGSSAEPVFHTAQSLFSDLVLRLFSEALHVGTWHLNNLSPSSASHSSLSPREVTLWRAEWGEASSTTSLNLSSVLWVVPLSCLSCFHFPTQEGVIKEEVSVETEALCIWE